MKKLIREDALNLENWVRDYDQMSAFCVFEDNDKVYKAELPDSAIINRPDDVTEESIVKEAVDKAKEL